MNLSSRNTVVFIYFLLDDVLILFYQPCFSLGLYQMVIDVRNTYETRIGMFRGAVDPSTTAFREFPSWVDHQFQLVKTESHQSDYTADNIGELKETQIQEPTNLPRVAMYCTGGIRCEKASSFLLSKGFKEVCSKLNSDHFKGLAPRIPTQDVIIFNVLNMIRDLLPESLLEFLPGLSFGGRDFEISRGSSKGRVFMGWGVLCV